MHFGVLWRLQPQLCLQGIRRKDRYVRLARQRKQIPVARHHSVHSRRMGQSQEYSIVRIAALWTSVEDNRGELCGN